jgi:hypothetical protein
LDALMLAQRSNNALHEPGPGVARVKAPEYFTIAWNSLKG